MSLYDLPLVILIALWYLKNQNKRPIDNFLTKKQLIEQIDFLRNLEMTLTFYHGWLAEWLLSWVREQLVQAELLMKTGFLESFTLPVN